MAAVTYNGKTIWAQAYDVGPEHSERLELSVEACRQLGIDSDAVVDGTDAVAAVHEGNYDAVLMDVEMPRMNGVEATIAIRREADPIPIIAVTAHAMATTRKACFEAGMDDFIAKPVTMGHLDAVLSRWIRAKRHAVVDEQAAPSV